MRGAPSETPLSQRPLRGGWDDSPMSAATEKGAGAASPPVDIKQLIARKVGRRGVPLALNAP